ncbi:polysaccharide deacetylase family protein [Alkalihalobacillus trypoxylicola]|uniref:NodB homology domain-containing protein n=1 Tax=Alkalihalobacillus trypoxylicola TaxID=519424 RepID=A0A162DGG3_9BACI|nr:polysaccharide deacetylase family protein [Alkalihalobacillus trypoxylicola]KYG29547.1 hypothetical protein AZF04_08490 [Alkalihalobacillus trypoxylicola]
MKKHYQILILFCLILMSGCQQNHYEKEISEETLLSQSITLDENKEKEELTHTEEKIENEATSEDTEELIDIDTEDNVVYLTFDDGPNLATSTILEVLQEYDAEATFFLMEPLMREYPQLVQNILDENHAIGLHGVTHNKDKFYESEQSALNEMLQGQETLKDLTGVHTNLIRTPYGSIPYLTESYRELFQENNFKIWDWNVDSSDWSLTGQQYVDSVINQIEKLDQANITPIILLHDTAETAEHLPTLLTYLKNNHFTMKKLTDQLKPYQFSCHERCYRLNSGQ